LLQKTDFDLLAASFLIKKKYEENVSYRSEESFKIILAESKAFMDSMQNIEFRPLPERHARKRKIMFDEEAPDETISDPIVNFRVNTYFASVDLILSELNRRFLSDNNENVEQISIFKDLSLLSKKRVKELKANPTQLPKDAFLMVCTIYKKYLKPEVICDEYLNFIQCFDAFLKTDEFPKYLHSDNDIAKDSDSELETENYDNNVDDDRDSLKNEIENHGSLLPVFRQKNLVLLFFMFCFNVLLFDMFIELFSITYLCTTLFTGFLCAMVFIHYFQISIFC